MQGTCVILPQAEGNRTHQAALKTTFVEDGCSSICRPTCVCNRKILNNRPSSLKWLDGALLHKRLSCGHTAHRLSKRRDERHALCRRRAAVGGRSPKSLWQARRMCPPRKRGLQRHCQRRFAGGRTDAKCRCCKEWVSKMRFVSELREGSYCYSPVHRPRRRRNRAPHITLSEASDLSVSN